MTTTGPNNKPFLTDVTELRRRAREHIENGPVTEGYRADRETGIIRTEAQGSKERIRARAESRMDEVTGARQRATEPGATAPSSVDLRDPDPAVRRDRA